MNKEYKIVDSVESLKDAFERVRKAQETFATYSQEQVDKIFKAAAMAANSARIPLAKMAVEETGMGDGFGCAYVTGRDAGLRAVNSIKGGK